MALRDIFDEEDILAAVHRGLRDYNKKTDAEAERILEMIKQDLREAGDIVADEEDREEIPDEILEATLKAIAEAMPDEDEGWADNA